MSKLSIAIGSDHAGFELKQSLINYLTQKGLLISDQGAFSAERADYPDFGHAVAKLVENGTSQLGILICGSGNGINMTANKHAGIRSALCWTAEIAELARQHNNANVLALPARFISVDTAYAIVDAFLGASFEGGRHADRIAKIAL